MVLEAQGGVSIKDHIILAAPDKSCSISGVFYPQLRHARGNPEGGTEIATYLPST